MKNKAFLICAIMTMLSARSGLSQGSIVPNGITYDYNPALGLGAAIYVLQNPTNGNFTGFFLRPFDITPPSAPNTNTFQFYPLLDEGVRTFFVGSGDAFTWQAIQSGGYTELLYPDTYLFPDGVPLYVGLYTGEGAPIGGPYSQPLFGWAQLVNNGGVIALLNGALAYGADGIYVGTQNIIQSVPEPGTMILIGLGLLIFGWGLNRGGCS